MRPLPLTYRQDFYSGLPIPRKLFLKEAQKCIVGKRNTIFRENLPGDACYYILSGLVRTCRVAESGKEAVLSMHYPGALLGLAEAVNGFPRRNFAEAVTRTTLYVLKREKFLSILRSQPDFAAKVFCSLGRQIRNLEERIASMILYNVMERLMHLLIFYHETMPELPSPPFSTPAPIRLSQQQIAAMIGSTQCTVSHLLQELRGEGLLTSDTKNIIIRDPEMLWDKVFRRPLGDVCS